MVCAALVAAVSSTHMALGQVPSDHDALLAGTESGELRQAEANGYPSPRRVLELEKELRLTDAQKKALKEVADEARPRAVELGKRIVGVEGEMNDAFRTGMVSEQSIKDDADQIGRLRGKLRAVFLTARLKARKALTPEQLSLYKNLKTPAQAPKQK
jgi:Spy/CpxP family protein refolding chaperone